MTKIIIFLFFAFSHFTMNADEMPWSHDYQKILMCKVGEAILPLSDYPSTEYPNLNYLPILKKYASGKVLLFGYGSLMNANSASRSISLEAIQSMKPVIAFGFKRIFNYNPGSKGNSDVAKNERAMLNIEPTTTYSHIINGVVMEVSSQDLEKLIQREVGYDLVPLLVANWNEAVSEKSDIKIHIAYAFLAPNELRKGISYTQTKYYPLRKYLHAVQKGAEAFGPKFLNYWNASTYLSDGTTPISKWNENTSSEILDSKDP